jgi:hypothetical protein
MMEIFITNSPPATHNPLKTTILAQEQTKSRPIHADTTNHTTNNTTNTQETTTLAQTRTQTKSALCHPATTNYAATDIVKNKTTRFQSRINFQTASLQLLPAETHFISSQFLRRRLINCVPSSSTATTTIYPPPSATLNASTKTWTSQGCLHPTALTEIPPHLPLHLKHLNLYSHTSVAPQHLRLPIYNNRSHQLH